MERSPSAWRSRCRRERQWIALRVDDALTSLERLRLERHLTRCPSCREFQAALEQVVVAIRTAPLERPSSPFRIPASSRPAVRARTALAAACVAAALLGVSLSGSQSSLPAVRVGDAPLFLDDHARDPLEKVQLRYGAPGFL